MREGRPVPRLGWLVVLTLCVLGVTVDCNQQLRAGSSALAASLSRDNPGLITSKRKPFADSAKQIGQDSAVLTNDLSDEQAALCKAELTALKTLEFSEHAFSGKERDQSKLDLTTALHSRIAVLQKYIDHLSGLMTRFNPHIERVNKIYQSKYKQAQEDLRAASAMLVKMNGLSLEPFNPNAIPIKLGAFTISSIPGSFDTTSDHVTKTTTTTTVEKVTHHGEKLVSKDVKTPYEKVVTTRGSNATNVSDAPASLLLQMHQALSRQSRAIRTLDTAMLEIRDTALASSTSQCKTAFERIYKMWTLGQQQYMVSYVEFEKERRVLAKFRDFLGDLIKAKKKKLDSLKDLLNLLLANLKKDKESDSPAARMEQALADHEALITEQCAKMRADTKNSVNLKMDVMTHISTCEGSSSQGSKDGHVESLRNGNTLPAPIPIPASPTNVKVVNTQGAVPPATSPHEEKTKKSPVVTPAATRAAAPAASQSGTVAIPVSS